MDILLAPPPTYVPAVFGPATGFGKNSPWPPVLAAGRLLYRPFVSGTGELLGLMHIEESESLLVGQWVTYCTPEVVVMGMRLALEMLIAHPCRAILSDGSAATGDWSDLVPWMQYDMLPRLVSSGVRYIANVRSLDPAGRLAHQAYASYAAQYLTIRLFDDPQTARVWLRQQLAADDATR
jgi:hypothetical protein